jgi:HisJ family histidinol phosphate phosphatase
MRIVESAKRRGFKTISITEHISQIRDARAAIKFGSTHSSGRMFESVESYLREFDLSDPPSIKVKKGLEVDYIPVFEDQMAKITSTSKLDFVLRSVHELADGKDIEESFEKKFGRDSDETWAEYIETEIDLVKHSRIRFDVVTHPVRLGKGSPAFPDTILESLTRLADACAGEGKSLELNGKDLVERPELVKKLARACKTANCNVSFGSDAHHSNEVGRGRESAEALIEEFHLQAQDS